MNRRTFDAFRQIPPGEEDLVTAGQAFQADIRAEPDHLPFPSPAGMGLLQNHKIANVNIFHQSNYITNCPNRRALRARYDYLVCVIFGHISYEILTLYR